MVKKRVFIRLMVDLNVEVGDVDGVLALKQVKPAANDGYRYRLQAAQFGADALGAPFVGIAQVLPAAIHLKNVGALGHVVFADDAEQLVDGLVEIVAMVEGADASHQRFLGVEPVLELTLRGELCGNICGDFQSDKPVLKAHQLVPDPEITLKRWVMVLPAIVFVLA